MGIEALGKVAVRQAMKDAGLSSENELGMSWGLSPRGCESFLRDADIVGEARRRIIFQGDTETHRVAKDVSDPFEHGYEDFGVLHQRARQVRDEVAKYLRIAIICLTGLEKQYQDALEGEEFAEPLAVYPSSLYVRGVLHGAGEALSQDGQPYPWIAYDAKVISAERNPPRRQFRLTSTFTVQQLPTGITFEPLDWEQSGPTDLSVEWSVEQSSR